jgi:Protein kinase domain/Bacterial Ig-like domain (group 2)/zinc-ribbon domain
VSAEAVCQRCGAPVTEGALFCMKCGADVTVVPSAEAATVEMPSLDTSPARVRSTMRQMLRDATLGEYEILNELGRGGMATVFLAHDISLDRKVAIKVMAPHLLEGEGMAERFKQEARTAAQLSHPHIIPIYAVKETESSLFFVMKYVEGKPLDDIIRKMGQLPIPMVKDILTKVGSALGYGHRRNVVHRDVKPANVMIDEEGNPIMTDFGIAKVAETKGLTMTGTTIGTPSYMSPEQCEAREVTGASDQYSLGVVAWEMLTGQVPFAGDSAVTTMYKQVHEDLPPLQDFRPDVPPEILETVTRMLAKKPADRWPSMEAAIRKLGTTTESQLDPIRSQLLELAKETDPSQLLAQLRTPGASLPGIARAGTTGAGAVAAKRSRAPLVAAAVLVIAVGGGLAVVRPWESAPPASAVDNGGAQGTPGGRTGSGDQAAEPVQTADQGGQTQAPAPTEPQTQPTTTTPPSVTGTDQGGRASTPPASPPSTQPRAAAVASVRISGLPSSPEPGDRATLTATALDANRSEISGHAVRWTSDDASVGTINANGAFTAVAQGSVEITAEIDGVTERRTIDVAPPSVATLTLDRTELSLVVGQRGTLTVTAQSKTGAQIATGDVAWRSSNSSAATVGPSGQVTAAGPGQATITATAVGVSANATVTVTVDTRTAIEGLVAAYARALESKDINEVRKAYPGMTAQQEAAFRQSLPATEQARLTVQSIEDNGDVATAQVTGTYVFLNGRRRDTVPASFQATFERVNGAWRLTQTR